MTYLLVSNFGQIRETREFTNINDAQTEYLGRISRDIELLHSMQIMDTSKIYNQYSIYHIKWTPQTHIPIIINTIVYDPKNSTFENSNNENKTICTPEQCNIQKNNIATAIERANSLIQDATKNINLFDITCKRHEPQEMSSLSNSNTNRSIILEKCAKNNITEHFNTDTSSIDENNENDENDNNNSDDSNDNDIYSDNDMSDCDIYSDTNHDITHESKSPIVHEIKDKIEQLQKIMKAKTDIINESEKKLIEERKQLADELCEISAKKVRENKEKEKINEGKKKFEVDRDVYKKINNDAEIDEYSPDIPDFFEDTYSILERMDDNGVLDDPNAYELFCKEVNENDTTKQPILDSFGIFK